MCRSYGAIPFDKIPNLETQIKVREGQRLEKPDDCPPAFYALFTRCWLTKPDARPSFLELRSELVQFAKLHKSEGAMRDIGATLAKAKAGAETVYVCCCDCIKAVSQCMHRAGHQFQRGPRL